MRSPQINYADGQRGAVAVEFALIAVIFFTLMFGIIEFGRLLFSINSVQEVTRRAAREQAVRWVSDSSAVQREAIFHPGSDGNYPGVIDVTNTKVQLKFYNTYANAFSGSPEVTYGGGSDSMTNFNNCLLNNSSCIRFVRATLTEAGGSPVSFNVIAPFMPDGFVLPHSTVIMPAEALGLL